MKFLKWFFILSMFVSLTAGAQAFEAGSNDIPGGSTINNLFIFQGMGCNGGNVSPEIHWSGEPAGTKSFAVTVYDPAAPTGSGFWHWVVVDIPANTHAIDRNPVGGPDGVTIANDYGTAQYGGPCPPQGKPHPYIFTVHALNVEALGLPAGVTNAVARFMIEGATIEKTSFTAYYGR